MSAPCPHQRESWESCPHCLGLNHCCGRTSEECHANPGPACAGTFLKWIHEAGAHHREQPKSESSLVGWACSICGKDTDPCACPDPVVVERERLKSLVLTFCHNKMHRGWHDELAKLFEVSP